MPFQKIAHPPLSQAVIRQLEELILQGILHPGQKLPGERDLAEQLGVSRPSLREAMARMQQDGLLVARPNSGVFVAEMLGTAFSPALVRLMSRHPRAAQDFLRFRKDLEGIAAERAASEAGPGDLAILDRILSDMRQAHVIGDPEAEAALDADFHMAIVEASHNIVALHMMRAMQDMLRQGMLFNRPRIFTCQDLRATLLEHHAAINAAIQSRNGPAARALLEQHLDSVAAALTQQQAADGQEALAQLRLRARDA
ncbi:MAG: FCD domain-containing protein [Paracoccus sp. (in: a-proteobacteria)]|nr:FCD domain-containing protein [Paracoccus sp. (in: a-proteobacteria)]